MEAAPCVLVVEDEPLISEMLSGALSDAGFEVIMANTGRKAFAQLDTKLADIDAVLTDIRLGQGPDGWEVGRHARELAHHIPVIYMSGDSTSDWTARGVPNSVMISKPFAPIQAITAISNLLNINGSAAD